MRHAIFSDAKNSNKIFILPEQDVHFYIERSELGKANQIVAEFKGKRVALPPGSIVHFVILSVITEQGGVSAQEPPSPSHDRGQIQ